MTKRPTIRPVIPVSWVKLKRRRAQQSAALAQETPNEIDPRTGEWKRNRRRPHRWPLLWFWLCLGFMVMMGAKPWQGTDHHLETARRMIADYEFGKDRSQLNYGAPVYAEAHAELALVRPGSESAPAARVL